MELNKDYLEKMKQLLGGDGFNAYIKSLKESPTKAVRVNTKKTNEEFLKINLDCLKDKISYEHAFYTEEDKLGSHPYWHAGLYYAQEPSAMVPIASIQIDPNAKVLDLCAAPGGKSGQIAERLSEDGLLVSNEVNTARAKILKENIERLGYRNVIVTNSSPEVLAQNIGKFFDIVVVDAPCSGEGMMRKSVQAVQEWTKELPKGNALRQEQILNSAAQLVVSGGIIVYSTCTFSKEENEDVVNKFLITHPSFKCVEPTESVKAVTVKSNNLESRRFYPHVARGEGQFVAVLQNDSKNETKLPKQKCLLRTLGSSEKRILEPFFDQLFGHHNFKLRALKNMFYIVPQTDVNLWGIHLMNLGVNIGEITNGRFEPSHQFFSAFGDQIKNFVNLKSSDERVIKYLHGDEIEVTANFKGYGALKIDNHTLGGIKVSGGIAKNLYPKKFRI